MVETVRRNFTRSHSLHKVRLIVPWRGVALQLLDLGGELPCNSSTFEGSCLATPRGLERELLATPWGIANGAAHQKRITRKIEC
jgi:hypothetical protein